MVDKKKAKKKTGNTTPQVLMRLKQADLDRMDRIIGDHGIANRSDAVRVAVRILANHRGEFATEVALMIDEFGRAKDE